MEETRDTGRLEAFSDGIFAVAITLLALEIKVPIAHDLPDGHGLGLALAHQWPIYLAFVTSFLFILIMWVNHHAMMKHIRHVDQVFLLLNGLLLMGVTLLPVLTALLAEYLIEPDARVAARIYSGAFLVIAIVFNRLWWYGSHNDRLFGEQVNRREVERITKAYRFGPLVYLIIFIVAFFSAIGSFALAMLIAVFYAIPTQDYGGSRR